MTCQTAALTFSCAVSFTQSIGSSAGAAYFQRCEILALAVTLDYQPRRVDMDILRQRSMRSLLELVNLFSFSGVALGLPRLRLAGYHGWGALADTVGLLYLQQVSSRDQVRMQAACWRAREDLLEVAWGCNSRGQALASGQYGQPRLASALPLCRQPMSNVSSSVCCEGKQHGGQLAEQASHGCAGGGDSEGYQAAACTSSHCRGCAAAAIHPFGLAVAEACPGP